VPSGGTAVSNTNTGKNKDTNCILLIQMFADIVMSNVILVSEIEPGTTYVYISVVNVGITLPVMKF
jgi:hypothetical protein